MRLNSTVASLAAFGSCAHENELGEIEIGNPVVLAKEMDEFRESFAEVVFALPLDIAAMEDADAAIVSRKLSD